MGKRLTSMVVALGLTFGAATTVSAASESDIIDTLNDSSVPAVYVTQAENYLRAHEVSASQADEIIAHINNAQAIVDKAGAKSVNDLTKAQQNSLLQEVTAAADVLGLTLSVSNGTITFYDADGNVVASFSLDGNEVKQTGGNSLYLAGGLSLLIAAAGAAVVSKKKVSHLA